MGYAVAREASRRGARVTLVTGPVDLDPPPGVEVVGVVTAEEMEAAVRERFPEADVLVMAAAVADYRPAEALESKKKRGKGGWRLDLVPTRDVLAGLKDLRRKHHFVCGFAAETEDLRANARKKLAAKGLDLVAANDVSREGVGFDADRNALTLLWPDGAEDRIPERSKDECARALWDAIQEGRRGR
jgi:phosphopantothenoylcysteine decarboxylase/phosphopantothenate--cysteine ligase